MVHFGIRFDLNVWIVPECYLCLPFISNPTTGQINMPQLSSYLSPLAFLLSPSHSGLSVKFSSFMSCIGIRSIHVTQIFIMNAKHIPKRWGKTSGITYPDSTDVSYSLSVGSLCRLIQKVFDDSILIVESETAYEVDVEKLLCCI